MLNVLRPAVDGSLFLIMYLHYSSSILSLNVPNIPRYQVEKIVQGFLPKLFFLSFLTFFYCFFFFSTSPSPFPQSRPAPENSASDRADTLLSPSHYLFVRPTVDAGLFYFKN